MRDKKRIDKIMAKLTKIWKMYPDMRFWQLLNAIDFPEEFQGVDLFFVEDDETLKIFEDMLEKYGKKK